MNRAEQPDNAAGRPDEPPARHARIWPRRSGEQDPNEAMERTAGPSRQASAAAPGTDAALTTGPLACGSAPTTTPPATAKPPWPAVTAIIDGVLPSTASRRTAHVGPVRAWLVHVAAVLAAAVVTLLMACASEAYPLLDFLAEIVVLPYRQGLASVMGSLLAFVVAIEVEFLVAGVVATIWGALPDEPMGRSLRWGLTRAWLWTGQVFWAVLLIGVLVSRLRLAERAYLWQPYDRTPWYVRRAEEIVAVALVAGMTWLYWGLLRWAGIRRPAQDVARPPRCEACGYSLVSIALEGRCPECGQPAAASLDPRNRCGAPWEQRGRTGLATAYLETAWTAIHYPRQLARRLRLTSDPRHARLFLLLSLGMAFAVSYLGLLACYVADTGEWPGGLEDPLVFAVAPCVATAQTGALATLTVLASGLVGAAFRLRHGGNLLAGTTQVACYLSAWFPIWTAVLFLAYAVGMALDADPIAVGARLGLPPLLAEACVIFGPPLALGVFYTLLVARGVQPLQYANR